MAVRTWMKRFAGIVLAGLLAAPVLAADVDAETVTEPTGAHGDESVNWYYGFLGEKEDLEHPSLLWREPGMPVPLAANFLNAGVLFFLLYHFGHRPVREGLQRRRQAIMEGMDQAAKMKAEAEEQLAHYEQKLSQVDSDIERIRREMREAAETERQHILREAKERRVRVEREAKLLISQELKAARETLFQDAVRAAVQSAEQLVKTQLSQTDHQRLADEYLQSLEQNLSASNLGRSGQTSSSLGGDRS